MRRMRGKPPKTVGWKLLAEVNPTGNRVWLIYVREQNDSVWTNFKVAAKGRANGKANYWLGWNGERWANQTDRFLLEENRPKLYDAVLRALEGYL